MSEKTKDAVLFDMDGVIVDSELYMQQVLAIFFEEETHYPVTALKLESFIGSSGQMEVWKSVFEDIEEPVDFTGMNQRLKQYLNSVTVPYSRYLMRYAKDILVWLKANKYKVGLASSSSMAKISSMLKECALEPYFECILSGEMFYESKPNPEIYCKLAKRLNVEPKKCLVVEDSQYGIQAGKNAGMETAALRDMRFSIDQRGADYMLNNLLEIKQILNH